MHLCPVPDPVPHLERTRDLRHGRDGAARCAERGGFDVAYGAVQEDGVEVGYGEGSVVAVAPVVWTVGGREGGVGGEWEGEGYPFEGEGSEACAGAPCCCCVGGGEGGVGGVVGVGHLGLCGVGNGEAGAVS